MPADHVSSLFSTHATLQSKGKRIGDGSGPGTNLHSQVDLLSQVVQLQALKIRRLEHALARIESVLPEWRRLGDLETVRTRLHPEEEVAEELMAVDGVAGVPDAKRKKWASVHAAVAAGHASPVAPSTVGASTLFAAHEHGSGGAGVGSDGKKKQTLYQAFMSVEIPRIKNETPNIAQKEAFKIAANNWARHPDNPKASGGVGEVGGSSSGGAVPMASTP